MTAERRGSLDNLIQDDDDVAIAAVTAAELLAGVELSHGKAAMRRAAFVDGILELVPLEPYDLEAARAHAVLLGHARRSGRPRGAHDLLIAATAVARERTVVSADPRGFDALPGVLLRAVAES